MSTGQLGRYRVLERLGGGGMGEVYRAYDPELRCERAVKVLPLDMADDPAMQARLMREAQLASRLRHHGICGIHDIGTHEGRLYVVMDLVEGETLRQRIATHGPLDPPATRAVAHDVAEALAYAHGQGVVHRDLSSANVMLAPDGRAVLLDFGLARPIPGAVVGSVTRMTQTGSVVGTCDYIAPEVLRGAEADGRADLWAIGVLIHEMLTGEPPFRGATPTETLAHVLSSPAPALPPQIPRTLAAAAARCLEKDPGGRFQRAEELLDALDARAPRASLVPGRRALSAWGASAVALMAVALVISPFICRTTGARISALAVLPLENLSGNRQEEYFADGMTDELTTTLAKLGDLRVIARSSVMRFKHTTTPLQRVAQQLGVQAVVEGSVVHAGDDVRITAQLVRAADAQQMWAESYERPVGNVLRLQDEVANAIAQQIRLKLSPSGRQSLGHERAVNPEAYKLYLQGRQQWSAYNPDAFQRALGIYQRVVTLDSTFAPAWAGIADCWWAMSSVIVDPGTAMPRAREAAEHALALDPGLDGAHVALGTVARTYDWDWDLAEREYRKALRLNPSSADAHRELAYVYRIRGRYADDRAQQDSARALDPLSDATASQDGWPEYFGHHYPEAERAFETVLRRAPQLDGAHIGLALTLEQLGRHDDALREADEAYRIARATEYLALKASILAAAGHTAEARALVARLTRSASGQFVPLGALAPAYLALGDRDRALQMLTAGVAGHNDWMSFIKVDPQLDPLHGDPRFQALLTGLRL